MDTIIQHPTDHRVHTQAPVFPGKEPLYGERVGGDQPQIAFLVKHWLWPSSISTYQCRREYTVTKNFSGWLGHFRKWRLRFHEHFCSSDWKRSPPYRAPAIQKRSSHCTQKRFAQPPRRTLVMKIPIVTWFNLWFRHCGQVTKLTLRKNLLQETVQSLEEIVSIQGFFR